MARPLDALLLGCAIELGMNVIAALARVLLLFDHQRVSLRIGILADSRDLPGDLHIRLVRPNAELMVGDFAAHNRLGELPDHGELIAEVGVERLKPLRQLDGRQPLAIRGDGTVVDIFHLRRTNRGVEEILVGGIERVVHFDLRAHSVKRTGDFYVALEVPRVEGRAILPAAAVGPRVRVDSVALVAALGHDSSSSPITGVEAAVCGYAVLAKFKVVVGGGG
jgi:hypothetical protein